MKFKDKVLAYFGYLTSDQFKAMIRISNYHSFACNSGMFDDKEDRIARRDNEEKAEALVREAENTLTPKLVKEAKRLSRYQIEDKYKIR